MFAFNASGIEYYTLGLLSDWRGFGVFDSDIKLKTSPPVFAAGGRLCRNDGYA